MFSLRAETQSVRCSRRALPCSCWVLMSFSIVLERLLASATLALATPTSQLFVPPPAPKDPERGAEPSNTRAPGHQPQQRVQQLHHFPSRISPSSATGAPLEKM